MAEKRTHVINVRVSTTERTVIRSRAERRGLDVSEHIRRAAAGDCSEQPEPVDVKALVPRRRFERIRRLLRRRSR